MSIANIENDRVKKPAPELVIKIAEVLDYPSDILLARAAMVDPNVEKVITKRPTAVPDFLRSARKLTIVQWEELKKEAEKMAEGDEK